MVATPHFVASRLVKSEKASISADAFSYSPWAVANITLSKLPAGKGAPLSWDNVVYNSPLLGYVVATHQIPQMKPMKTVVTYYWPLSHLSPADARKEALSRSYKDWQKIILKELLHVHPELEGYVEQLDVWVWGHAMVRPTRGFIWGTERKKSPQATSAYLRCAFGHERHFNFRRSLYTWCACGRRRAFSSRCFLPERVMS